MLYMVRKVFLYETRFNIVYNESGHKTINNVEYLFFTEFRKNINLLKTEIKGQEQALCCHTHIYLSNKTIQIQIIG